MFEGCGSGLGCQFTSQHCRHVCVCTAAVYRDAYCASACRAYLMRRV